MTTRPSAVFTLKGASSFRQPTSFVCIRAQPIPISLARIRHLHNEGWMEDSSAGLSLYKPFFLCSPQHNLGCSLSLCPGLQSLLAQINSFYSLLQPKPNLILGLTDNIRELVQWHRQKWLEDRTRGKSPDSPCPAHADQVTQSVLEAWQLRATYPFTLPRSSKNLMRLALGWGRREWL